MRRRAREEYRFCVRRLAGLFLECRPQQAVQQRPALQQPGPGELRIALLSFSSPPSSFTHHSSINHRPTMATPYRLPANDDSTTSLVVQMPRNSSATSTASRHGLNISTVSWEDNARSKNSCWGPCISDMTLSVNDQCMPLIKASSNFVDETWDVEIENIPLVVGNEDGSMLRTVTLKEYLKNFRDYLHTPSSWKGNRSSLLVDTDQHVICSAQACFLPMPKSGDAKFNVAIQNYQSSSDQPAVLAIVASSNGTSAEILDGTMQKLYHNKNGEKASYIGQRLSDFREETGSSLSSDAPMTASEKQQNMLLIIQIPLKNTTVMRSFPVFSSRLTKKDKDVRHCSAPSSIVDVESAIIKVGESEGIHREIGNCEIERDPQFPVRVTLQYYKATSNGCVDDKVMSDIAAELQAARKWAVAISSLVTETTNRTTEHSVHHYPLWWNQFWKEHSVLFPQYHTSDAAALMLFANNRFAGSQIVDVREQVLDLLGKGEGPKPAPVKVTIQAPQLPSWDVL